MVALRGAILPFPWCLCRWGRPHSDHLQPIRVRVPDRWGRGPGRPWAGLRPRPRPPQGPMGTPSRRLPYSSLSANAARAAVAFAGWTPLVHGPMCAIRPPSRCIPCPLFRVDSSNSCDPDWDGGDPSLTWVTWVTDPPGYDRVDPDWVGSGCHHRPPCVV